MDSFPSNSKKNAEQQEPAQEKKVERVVKGTVVIKKKSLGSKLHDLFIGGDSRSALTYISTEVLLPALRNMLVDATTKGVERIIYGETASRRPPSYNPGRVQYNAPVNRYNPRSVHEATAAPMRSAPYRQGPRYEVMDLIFAERAEAEHVLEMMGTIIEQYQFVTVADLHELAGLPSSHTDNKWGWTTLKYAQTKQIREGFLIDFPPVEPN